MEKLLTNASQRNGRHRTGITVSAFGDLPFVYRYERFAHVQYVKDDPVFQRMSDWNEYRYKVVSGGFST